MIERQQGTERWQPSGGRSIVCISNRWPLMGGGGCVRDFSRSPQRLLYLRLLHYFSSFYTYTLYLHNSIFIYRIIVTKSCPPCTYVMLFYLISSIFRSFICVLSVCHDKNSCTIFIIKRYRCRCDQLL